MNDSALIAVGLPVALAIIMFGLGLSLVPKDFRRVVRGPRAVVVALTLQVVVLPAVAFGLVQAFQVDPLIAVGVMLLAASPGGTTANLFSYLFRGDVALNVTLTAINSVLAALTIPLITNLAIDFFDAGDALGLQFGKVVQVVAIVLVPVGIGMVVRQRSEAFAARTDRPVRVFSIVVLAAVSVDTVHALTGRGLDLNCNADFAEKTLASLEKEIPTSGSQLLLPRARRAVEALQEVQNGFFIREPDGSIMIEPSAGKTAQPRVAVAQYLKLLRDATHGHGTTRNRQVEMTSTLLARHNGYVPHDVSLLGWLYLLDLLARPDVLRRHLASRAKRAS